MPEREDTRPIKVEVRNLTKRFGDLLVLDNMSFNIRICRKSRRTLLSGLSTATV